MKIGVLQASSQRDKNQILYECTKEAVRGCGHQVVNFGVFSDEEIAFSYVQTALCASFLLESKAVDYIVTGCSSGQGMMLACNSLPGILCGYAANPSDAYLFGRINNGNAVSYPLGLNFGWAGEINLQNTLNALFQEPFGVGYPRADAERKRRDTSLLKDINRIAKRKLLEVLPLLDREFISSIYLRKNICQFILDNGTCTELLDWMKEKILHYEKRER